MRAIDLYAGIGGWSLGLKLAGVEVVSSYEYWQPAIDTHAANHGHDFSAVNIRKLNLSDLPDDIDIVVGSPPCTQFSYANRGGKGDIADGLKDLLKFFEVVEYLQPKFWAMENVPRVAKVLEAAFSDPEHALYRFKDLGGSIQVVDFSEYGTPQSRRRCIATNIPFGDVEAFRAQLPRRTLGDVLGALESPEDVVDPVWGVTLSASQVTDTEREPALNEEELRMNREAKEFHPVYNNMAFPEPTNEPARTVTATCTRVSRESLVVEAGQGRFRRLTIRERACLQGFPITYQFHAKSFAEKAKMIGNAIPPTIPYLLALAAQGVSSEDFEGYSALAGGLALPEKLGTKTNLDREGRTYPANRKFRAAVPGLRFKSGMRFDLSNNLSVSPPRWEIRFFFGPSKDIREIDLDGAVTRELARNELLGPTLSRIANLLQAQAALLDMTTPSTLQAVWAHLEDGVHPHQIVDLLGDVAGEVIDELEAAELEGLDDYLIQVAAAEMDSAKVPSEPKLRRNAVAIIAGILVGEWFNRHEWQMPRKKAA